MVVLFSSLVKHVPQEFHPDPSVACVFQPCVLWWDGVCIVVGWGKEWCGLELVFCGVGWGWCFVVWGVGWCSVV